MTRKLFWILLILPLLGLAPRAHFSRDFDVAPFLKISPERARRLETLLPRYDYVVFDFETTGLNVRHAKIIEIGALKFRGTRLIGKFYALIDPQEPLESIITEITGLTHTQLQGQPTADQVLPQFLKFIQGCDLVGHNISSSDVPILENQLQRLRLAYPRRPWLHDTRKMGHGTIRRGERNGQVSRYKLHDLARLAGSPIIPDHNAVKDAVANTFIFWDLLEKQLAVKQRFNRKFNEEWDTMADHFSKMLDFLQGNDRLSETTRAFDLTVVLSNDHLDWIDKAAGGYQQGKIKKMLVFAEGARNVRGRLSSLADACLEEMWALGIDREDLLFERHKREIDERLRYMADVLKNRRIWNGKVAVVAEWRSLRRCRLLVEQLKKERILPRNIEFNFIPLWRVEREVVRDRGELEKMVRKVLMEYDMIHFYIQEKQSSFPIPPEVKRAYEYLSQLFDLSAPVPQHRLESSV